MTRDSGANDGTDSKPPVTLAEIETTISLIPGVVACRVKINDWGAIEEIHVISTLERNPKAMSRDIQSALLARWDVNVDYRKISIAQLTGMEPTMPPERLKVLNVDLIADVSKGLMKVRVSLGPENDPETLFVGEARGSYGRTQIPRVTAEAAVNAINQVVEEYMPFTLEDAGTTRLGGLDIAIVTVGYFMHRADEEVLVGAAAVKFDIPDAVVRATLDAVNRRLSRLHRSKNKPKEEGEREASA